MDGFALVNKVITKRDTHGQAQSAVLEGSPSDIVTSVGWFPGDYVLDAIAVGLAAVKRKKDHNNVKIIYYPLTHFMLSLWLLLLSSDQVALLLGFPWSTLI